MEGSMVIGRCNSGEVAKSYIIIHKEKKEDPVLGMGQASKLPSSDILLSSKTY